MCACVYGEYVSVTVCICVCMCVCMCACVYVCVGMCCAIFLDMVVGRKFGIIGSDEH